MAIARETDHRVQQLQANHLSEKPSLELLEEAVKKFKENPQLPEIITQYWQTLWKVWGERVNLSLMIPFCDRTTEEIKQLEKEGRKLVYVPGEVASQENRHLLGKMFPEMNDPSVRKDNFVTNDSNQGGWFDIEASFDSPNVNVKEKDLEYQFNKKRKAGQRINTYIVGSQDAKLQTGHYFDENNWSRLLGSRGDGRVVRVLFHVNSGLDVRWGLVSRGRLSRWGGRSEGVGVKKA